MTDEDKYSRIAREINIGEDGMPKYEAWISNQPHVQRNVIPLIIRNFSADVGIPDYEKISGTVKALMELHPIKRSSFRATATRPRNTKRPRLNFSANKRREDDV